MFHFLAQISAILLVVVTVALLARYIAWSLRLPSDHDLMRAWCQERELRFLGTKLQGPFNSSIANPFLWRSDKLDPVYYVSTCNQAGQPEDFWALCRRSPFKNFVPELIVKPARRRADNLLKLDT